MSTPVILNGITYLIPTVGETGWGQETTNYLVALGSGSLLSLDGGNFPLINEVNFGPNYGLASPYFRSGQDPAADAGVLRLTNSESIMWRNSTDTGNLALYVVGNQLYFAGNPVGGGTSSPLTTKGDIYTYSTANTRLPVGSNGQALIADSSTATGLAWATIGGGGGGSVVGFSFNNANGISGTVNNPTTTPELTLSLGAITPTSVAASGTISASNFTGSVNGTFTGTSSGTNTGDQTITLTGDVTGSGTGSFATTLATVPIAKGGTGQTTANDALNALLPTQAGNNGKVLLTDGTNTSWQNFPGAGSVTSVSGTGSQGVSINVTNPTTTPVIAVGLGAITPTSVAASGTVTGSNISGSASGTNTGDQTITLTGDVTGSGTGTFAATLANTAVTPGSYTLASITVDSKGRITAAASGSPQTITLTGDVTGSGTGSFATTLSNTGVSAGTYNNVSVDAKGRVTSASNVGYITGNQTITVSGDATGSGTTGITLTLANTSVAAGSYTNANITVDSKGRITAASNGGTLGTVTSVSVATANGVSGSVANPTTTPSITLTLGNITPTSVAASGTLSGSNLSGTNTGDQTITLTGDVTGSGTGSFAATLANTGVSAGTYGTSSQIPRITVDAKGRITSLTTVSAGSGSVTNVSFTSANGFTGSVSNPTTTPAISVGTSVTGILYGNGTGVSAATAGNFPTLNQNTTGSAAKLTTARDITATGDASWTVSFDGSANVSSALTLANTAVTPGSYTVANVTVDSKGRITAASNASSANIITALGFTPAAVAGVNGSVQYNNSGTQAGDIGFTYIPGNPGPSGLYAGMLNVGSSVRIGTRDYTDLRGAIELGASGIITNTSTILQPTGGFGSFLCIQAEDNTSTIGSPEEIRIAGSFHNASSSTGVGGVVSIVGGGSSRTNGTGGNVFIAGGAAVGTGSATGGSVFIYPGAGATSGIVEISPGVGTGVVHIGQASAGITVKAAGIIDFDSRGTFKNSAQAGTATLSSGAVTVTNTSIGASSIIMLTRQGSSSNYGHLYISAISAGASFTITSTDSGDNGSIGWFVVKF